MLHPIDLHAHSSASDGLLSPSLLVQRAFEKGIKILALTDHDTIEGLPEAKQQAITLGIELIDGIELSCVWSGITIHLLGYGFNAQSPEFIHLLETMNQARWLRANKIAEKLHQKGMIDLLDCACAYKQSLSTIANPPGRLHFAEAMVQKGYVKTHKEAFQKWLGNGKIGDIKQHWLELTTVTRVLKQSNAWISLAHPYQYNMTRSKLSKLLSEFITCGGQAMEVVNGFQPDQQVGKLTTLCRNFGLLATAGSDFHTPNNWTELGLYRPLPIDLPPLYTKWPKVNTLLKQND